MAQIILFQNLEHLGNKFQEILKGKRSMYLEREKKKAQQAINHMKLHFQKSPSMRAIAFKNQSVRHQRHQ